MTPSAQPTVIIVGLTGMPEIARGADLVALTAAAVERAKLTIDRGDVLVFTQKIVSKAEGRVVRLDSVTPSSLASQWGDAWGRDPRAVQLVLQEAVRVVRMDRGIIITETEHGFICANSGVDTSNVQPGEAALLPLDPDASARRLCHGLRSALGADVGVIVSDTFGRPWREGQTDVAIGVAGMRAVADYRGSVDTFSQPLRSTMIATADEIAGAAELVMGKTRAIPVVVVKGTGIEAIEAEGTARDLVRRADMDFFR